MTVLIMRLILILLTFTIVSCAVTNRSGRLTLDTVHKTMRGEGVEHINYVNLRYLQNQSEWLAEVNSAPAVVANNVCLTKKYQLGFVNKNDIWVNDWIVSDDFVSIGSNCISQAEDLISVEGKLEYEGIDIPINMVVCHLNQKDNCIGLIKFSSMQLENYFYSKGKGSYVINSIHREGPDYSMIILLSSVELCQDRLVNIKIAINNTTITISDFIAEDYVPH